MTTNKELIELMERHGLNCRDVAELLYKSVDTVKKWRQTTGRVPMDQALLELLKIKLALQ